MVPHVTAARMYPDALAALRVLTMLMALEPACPSLGAEVYGHSRLRWDHAKRGIPGGGGRLGW